MRLIDSMPPATTTSASAEPDGARRHRDRLQAGGAGLVDRHAGDGIGEAGTTNDLTPGVRPRASLARVSDQDLFDARRIDARAVERRLDGDRAEFGRMCVAERAAVAANRASGPRLR